MLEPASLFDQQNISEVWIEVVERTETFLRGTLSEPNLSSGTVAGSTSSLAIPSSDRHSALSLLLELAVQKGTLLQVRLIICQIAKHCSKFKTNSGIVSMQLSVPRICQKLPYNKAKRYANPMLKIP